MLVLILTVIIIFLISIILAYKHQINEISKQIEFIINNHTNKTITTNINFGEILQLVDKLNELLADQKDSNLNYNIKERDLREAIANISHDIRTPLTSLNGYFQLLIETDNQDDKDRYVSIVQTRIEILKELLDDMFTYIKIQDSNYKIEKEKININNLIQENLLSYYEEFIKKDIVPIIDIPDKPVSITANKVYFNRIIANLISNSLIHGNNFISVTVYENNKTINITFENDVINAKDIDLANIFNRFYKTDYARTNSSTGLGLAIVKELVINLNGKITASSTGDIFKIHISLPVV